MKWGHSLKSGPETWDPRPETRDPETWDPRHGTLRHWTLRAEVMGTKTKFVAMKASLPIRESHFAVRFTTKYKKVESQVNTTIQDPDVSAIISAATIIQ